MSNYQVLARKWRPQTFDDVVGQDAIVRTLSNAIARNRIGHAYLLVGPRGIGKTSLARIFAKALNCTQGPRADFDPADPAVMEISEGRHMDVIEIDGASNNSVEQVRDLRETVPYAPAKGRFKIYIIDEVHMLSSQAFNALLKTLEEPPAHVKFIFATTDVQKVLPTILSRCQRFDLKPIAPELIAIRLRKIAAAEKISVDDDALACIARLADGGMRDAQSIFDQMISFCGAKIGEADVLDVYGLVSAAKVSELAATLAAGDQKKIVEIVDDCDAAGRDLARLLADLQWSVRSALLDSISQGGRSGLLGTVLTSEQIARLLEALRDGEGGVKYGLAEKINFEVVLFKAVEASRARAIDSLIKELAALEAESAASDSAPPGGASPDNSPDRPSGEKKKDRIAELERRLSGTLNPSNGTRATVAGVVDPGGPASARPATARPATEPESGPRWPATEEEAAYSAESTRDESVHSQESRTEPSADGPPLPELDALVNRIPENVRAALDELFRARFTAVKRMPKQR